MTDRVNILLPIVDAGRWFLDSTLQNVELVGRRTTVRTGVEIARPDLTNFDQTTLNDRRIDVRKPPHRSLRVTSLSNAGRSVSILFRM